MSKEISYNNENGDKLDITESEPGHMHLSAHCECPHINNGACGECATRMITLVFKAGYKLASGNELIVV